MALQKAICVCRGGIRARENELFFHITKGQLMSFSVSPQMDLFPTKLNCAARTGGYIHHHYYYWFLDLKKIQVVVRYVPGKKIAKRIIIIRILFFERAQFSLGA
jgi:hypothetical protein